MNHIYIPTTGVDDWQKLLADPYKHWRKGFSARALAYAWESAKGFPPEIQALLASSEQIFHNVELLLVIPEHKVLLPPNNENPSQNDIFALAKDGEDNLIALTVEGKVSESFGELLSRWNAEGSKGKRTRLAFIQETLGLAGELPHTISYPLLHHTVSAVLEAKRFAAKNAVMVVQSFSPSDEGFVEYQTFLKLFGVKEATPAKLYFLTEAMGVRLYSGWARGDAQYLEL